jgi:hypothetical protein
MRPTISSGAASTSWPNSAVGAGGRSRIRVPAGPLQAIAVAGFLAGLVVGTSRPLGVVLIGTGLLATIVYQYGRHHPRTPHGRTH